MSVLLTLLVAVLVAAGLIVIAWRSGSEVAATLGIGVALIAILMASAVGYNKVMVGGDMAAIAELRRVSSGVDLTASEDIAGKVADTNVEIRRNQWMNRQWWGDAFIPDEWDTVKIIRTPEHHP